MSKIVEAGGNEKEAKILLQHFLKSLQKRADEFDLDFVNEGTDDI